MKPFPWSLGSIAAIAIASPLTLTVSPAPAIAQDISLEQLLQGDPYPTSRPLSSLDDRWRIVTVVGQPETASMMQFTGAMFGIGPNSFYTRGETVEIAGESFLVAYRQPKAEPGIAVDPELEVPLSLINLRLTASFNDFKPFSLPGELARLRQQSEQQSGFPFPFPVPPPNAAPSSF
ncbi:MAG: hypothetical protein Fur0042_25510 [Cyanophyceae cyanobacterium]